MAHIDTAPFNRSEEAVEEFISSTVDSIREEMKDLSKWKINRNFHSMLSFDLRMKGDEDDGRYNNTNESVQQEQSSGDTE
jgi:hypothetical protein